MGTGAFFMACWPLYTNTNYSRYFASLVPLLITFQFVLVGFGFIRDQAAVQAMSRTGDRREILRGPLYYGVVFVTLTIFYWYDSPVGIIALMAMCGGDGLADILGRRFGQSKLPWNKGKSWIGSLGMLAGGWVFSAVIIAIFIGLGVFKQSFRFYIFPLTVIALVATAVESLPLLDIDNLTVTAAAVATGHLLF
jgi:phytol kinase